MVGPLPQPPEEPPLPTPPVQTSGLHNCEKIQFCGLSLWHSAPFLVAQYPDTQLWPAQDSDCWFLPHLYLIVIILFSTFLSLLCTHSFSQGMSP